MMKGSIRARDLEVLRALAEHLNREVRLEPMLDSALALILQLLHLQTGWVILLGDEGRFVPAAARGLPRGLAAQDRAASRWTPCRCQQMLLTGELDKPATIVDCERLERIHQAVAGASPEVVIEQTGNLHLHVSVPLRVGGRVLGLLNLARAGKEPLDPPTLTLLGLLANTLGVAIERATLYEQVRSAWHEEVKRRLQELTLLHDVTATAARASDLDEVLHAIIGKVKAHLGYEHLWIMLCEGERLRVRATDETSRLLILELPLGEGVTGWVAQTGEPALLPDVEEDPRYRIGIPETRSELCVPLKVGNRVIGVINAESSRPRAFSDSDLRLLSIIADEVSMLIERSQLLQTTQRQLHALTALFEISTALRAARTTQELASALTERAAHLVQADAAMLCMADRTKEQIVTLGAWGVPEGAVGRRQGIEQGISGLVLRTGTSYRSSDLGSDPLTVHRDLLVNLGAGVCVPLRTTEGEVVGTLLVARARGNTTPFSPDEERLLSTLAEIGGNALQRAGLFEELEEAYLQAIVALSRAIDARDSATGQHSNRIAFLAAAVAQAMGCSREDTEAIWWGAVLHDIGKLAVPDEILRKPAGLTEEEWRVIRRHPEVGAEIVAPLRRLSRVIPLIRHHQERWDGTGYPDGLKGEEIPLGARILAAVDAYVAMTEDRPYRTALSHEQAIEELRRQAGKQFDPRVVEVFCRVIERGEEHFKQAPPVGDCGGYAGTQPPS